MGSISLDLLLVAGLGSNPGAGLGTSIAKWIALCVGLVSARRILGRGWWRIASRLLFDPAAFRRLIAVNADIMVRTIALLLLFTWFAQAGARLGPVTLAANHVLLQFVSVSAYVLDGFALQPRRGAARR